MEHPLLLFSTLWKIQVFIGKSHLVSIKSFQDNLFGPLQTEEQFEAGTALRFPSVRFPVPVSFVYDWGDLYETIIRVGTEESTSQR